MEVNGDQQLKVNYPLISVVFDQFRAELCRKVYLQEQD